MKVFQQIFAYPGLNFAGPLLSSHAGGTGRRNRRLPVDGRGRAFEPAALRGRDIQCDDAIGMQVPFRCHRGLVSNYGVRVKWTCDEDRPRTRLWFWQRMWLADLYASGVTGARGGQQRRRPEMRPLPAHFPAWHVGAHVSRSCQPAPRRGHVHMTRVAREQHRVWMLRRCAAALAPWEA